MASSPWLTNAGLIVGEEERESPSSITGFGICIQAAICWYCFGLISELFLF
jgi:hypothetical protein